MGLLDGLRILAVEQYGAGPFGTQALADLGAEVIKIENPREGGDVTRQLGPYFAEGFEPTAASLFFQSINRNKKSVAIDLTDQAGQAVFHDLVRTADAVAGNLRGDVPAKLGLTFDALQAINPKIVCAHLSAYGRAGSRAMWPGYDYLIQAEAGYFSLNGEPDAPPSRFGLSIIDFATGYCLAIAVLAGVRHAAQTGRGRDVDVNLFDVGLANLNYLAVWAMNAGYSPGRLARSGHPSLTPCQLFPTADGWIYIMANKEKFWPILCDRLDAPDLAHDVRFRTFKERLANRAALSETLDPLFRRRNTAEWLGLFAGSIPCAPIRSVEDALASPFVAESEMIVEIEAENGARARSIGSPFRTGEVMPRRAGPTLGRHTDELMAEIGYPAEAIAELRKKGTLG